MPSNKLNKMKHKADNLRTIEQLIFLLPDAAPDAALIKTEYSNYIKNLKIILVGLLDSIHDFKTAGPVITGDTGYIKYIIDIYILPEANRISINSDIKKHIINWINGWNSLFNPNLGGFVNVPAHTQGHSGSIYEFISNATGHDDAEHFVALLLNVDSVTLNRYSTPMLRPVQANITHNNHIAVVNDYSTRMDDCPHFLDSLYQVKNTAHKFFTIRDNGFGSYIFHNRDTNAVPPALSLTDTIYTGPGKWDNGGNEQNVTNILNKKQQARGLDSNTGDFTIITHNILNRMRYVAMPPNTHADDTHADGGVFGFQNILIYDSFKKSDDSVIQFGNKIFYGNNKSIDYSTTVNLNFLKNLEKGLIKTGTQTLLRNVTSISKYDLQDALEPWFDCADWPPNNMEMNGDAVINFALSQPELSKRKNVMMLIGCLLDIKRSGDFIQSASVKCLENLFVNSGQQRQGIFATNDRIAGYISAKIHNNYTILSIKGSPLTMTAIWNARNNTTRHQGRAPIRPEDLTSTNKLVTVGGGNKRQKYGGNKGINMKNKKGGVFIPQKNPSASVNDFYWLLENITTEINKWENTKHNMESHFVHTYNLAKYMYQFYGYIKEHQELIRNLFKIFFSNKITNFDDKLSILDTSPKEHALKNMSDLIDSQSQYGGLKQLLLDFMSSGAFKQIPNFIEKLDIIHLNKKEEISFVGSFADVKEVFLPIPSYRYTTTKMQMFSRIIKHVYDVYNPYIYILDVIFSYQRHKTIDLIMKIDTDGFLGTPALSSVVGEITDEVLASKTNALSLWVLENESVLNLEKEYIMELLQSYYDNIYNLKDLATILVNESNMQQPQEFHVNVMKGLHYYEEVQVNYYDYFKTNLKIIDDEVKEEARRLAENKHPLKRQISDATSDGSYDSDGSGSDGDYIPKKRTQRARVTPRQSNQAGGSTKIVFYSVKIEKLRELNKKLIKNKTKNKNKIEKNNEEINELKIKIKKEKHLQNNDKIH